MLEILSSAGKVKPSALGVSRSYFYQMRKGLRPIPDHITEKLLNIAGDDDLARVPELARYVNFADVARWELDRMLRMVLSWAESNPASASVLLRTLEAELKKKGIVGPAVYVDRQLWEEWERYLEARVVAGSLSAKQARDHKNYLKRLLESTGWVLASEPVRRVVLEVARGSPKAAQKMAEAARLFAREVVRDKQLWEELPRFRARGGEARAPTWEEYCRVLEATAWPPARAILYVALTGLRIETLYTLSMKEIDIERRIVAPMRDRRRKRDWFSFVPAPAAAYLRDVYMEWREVWLLTKVKGQDDMKTRLIPVKPKRIRSYLYNIMDRVLGYRFQLGKIRHRVTTQLSLHLPSLWVEILTGHAPRRIVQEHYLQRDVMESMRAKYDEAMLTVSCLR